MGRLSDRSEGSAELLNGKRRKNDLEEEEYIRTERYKYYSDILTLRHNFFLLAYSRTSGP
jgi:hypothetical protein